MVTGYLWGVWRTRRVDLAQRLADACQARAIAPEAVMACVIGEPYPAMAARVVLRPNGTGLLGRVVYELTAGGDARKWRHAPTWYAGVAGEADYEKHLAALGIALQGEVDEGSADAVPAPPAGEGLLEINGQMLERLQQLRGENPGDWTFAAALSVYTGDFPAAIALLLDPATACPSYTRESVVNCKVSWLFAARLVLHRYPAE
jgi:hypothetical protein